MRIGLVIYGDLGTQSGGYLYDRRLVERLREAGDEVEILSLPWRGYARHLGDAFNRAWADRLRAFHGDVLVEDELNHPSLLAARRHVAAGIQRISLVHHLRCSERRPGWQNVLYRAVEKAYLRDVDGFVFNSQTTRATVEALAGARRPSIVAVPAGDRWQSLPDETTVVTRATRGGPLRVIAVGNVIARKGLHTLIAGLAALPRERWTLTIAGRTDAEPAYATQLRKQITARGLTDQVTLAGGLGDTALREALEDSDVLAVPSSYEGYGIVYVEGMGFGLPALAGAAGAAGEIITPGVDGWLVPAGDATAITDALRPLLDNRTALAMMSLAARRRYVTHPTWAESMDQVRNFLLGMARVTSA